MVKLYKKITNNTAFKVIERLFSVFITLILTVLLVIIVVQKISNNRFNLGGYGIYTVASGSMEPDYKVKDLILSVSVDPKTIKVGDDIVYYGKVGNLKDKIITHRVVKVEEKNGKIYLVTRGIANSLEDPEIEESQVLGIVEHKLQLLSFVSRIINSLYGFIFLIIIPFIIFVFYEIKCIIDEYYKNKEG